MNAVLRRHASEVATFRLSVPEAARVRLTTRLGQAGALREAFTACAKFGASWPALRELLHHFATAFDLEHQALFDLPCFEASLRGGSVCFVHARSEDASALPLLLLHGYTASLAEFQDQVRALTSGAGGQAFQVVCPSLPGFGLTSGSPLPDAAAELCADLMATLGYTRYLVHGSDLGAKVALELAARDAAHVAALHVTALPAFPEPSRNAAAALTPPEKSQLARLAELEREARVRRPKSPLEELAYALARTDDELGSGGEPLKNGLLTGALLTWSLGQRRDRARLHWQRLQPAPPSSAPVALHTFPLDAPSLRRFASQRYRVVEWHEHPLGGSAPALEQPETWLASICGWGAQLR